ncbi:histidine kinase [Frankia sp. AgB1.9]|uniref:MHYT domain-containing protein n=1 Tax=unclassified Frankia TaxID=2632575 RepID=UPI001933FFC0|nr:MULTISPECIES: MHYT domain-containing protein [unclassified Frankia]MBL7491828.1 histidine kinase [Frankia sp. AgW1.1]MBL7549747.1 histidine kinase [Frankia sp. AgB1.9]MBL7618045.1 histidine kinase [Frankia sp. AgB1.8]
MTVAAQLAHEHGSDDIVFVITSVIFALVGSFAALVSAVRIPSAHGAARFRWIAASAISLGGGAIWSMHFIGMLGYHVDNREIVYNLPLTALSLLIAVGVSAIGLAIVGANPRNKARLLFAGILTGAGVGAMHYTGMAAMRVGSSIKYDPKLVAASLAIAVVAALAALWIAFRVRTIQHIIAASAVMAAAVCGMHYTGMAATTVAVTKTPRQDPGTDPISLTFLVCVIAFTVLILVIFAAFNTINENHADLAPGRATGRHSTAPVPVPTGRPTEQTAERGTDPGGSDLFAGRR